MPFGMRAGTTEANYRDGSRLAKASTDFHRLKNTGITVRIELAKPASHNIRGCATSVA